MNKIPTQAPVNIAGLVNVDGYLSSVSIRVVDSEGNEVKLKKRKKIVKEKTDKKRSKITKK